MLPGTAQAWIEALTDGRAWDRELDGPRVRRAFVVLTKTVRRWPAPVEFAEALPPRDQLALTKQPIPASPEVAEAAMAECREALRNAPAPSVAQRRMSSLSAEAAALLAGLEGAGHA